MDEESLQSFIGRTQSIRDVAAAGTLAALAALLDHTAPPWTGDELPPLAHWLYFLPRQRQSLLDADGHPKRGDFLPPVTLPRRMWVGSRVRQLAPVPLDAVMERRSTIAAITAKSGTTGPMVFVTVKHEVVVGDSVAVIEEQDIVYRATPASRGSGSGVPAAPASTRAAAAVAATSATARAATATRRIVPDPVLLFRFSALTFNAHRIHYDRDYAREVEGYPGLVVHGPLVATLLMDHYLRHRRDALGAAAAPRRDRQILNFSFRAERPLFDTAPFEICLAESSTGFDLWSVDPTGAIAVSATVENR